MNKQKRFFFAINLPEKVKDGISEELLAEIPKEKWRKVKAENCHITIKFLGPLSHEAIKKLEEKTIELSPFECFEAELAGVGHFKNRVLWVGVGKGTTELMTLNKKLCGILSAKGDEFHPHITLARNYGSQATETGTLLNNLRAQEFKREIAIKNLDLMESVLHSSGPAYKKIFSVKLRPRDESFPIS